MSESKTITSFVKTFLLTRYDNPVPIPDFHKEIWELATTEGNRRIAIAAPRGFAKSTAVTHALTLYQFLFRKRRYGIIVSDTESQASQFLGDIKTELLENSAIRDIFGVKRLIKDAVTDIVVELSDGHTFRIQALGAEQKIRGRKWRNLRPDYIVCDDLENDEMMENDTRRDKSKNWFFKALIPCLSKNGIIIIVGTILHLDSILMLLMNNKSWERRLYKAHKSFGDFSELLWPEQWTIDDLKKKRQELIDDGFPEGYSQEYLNNPLDHSEAFFRQEDFLEIEEEMRGLPLNYYGAVDFAISDTDRRAYTVILVGGMDQFGRLHIVHVSRFRGDANDIVEALIETQRLYKVEMWKMEQGQIKQTLMGELYNRMNRSGVYLNIIPAVPTKDKRSRASAIQARMRAGGVYFDKQAEWFPTLYEEMLQFPKGTYKDQVDALSWLGIFINELNDGPSREDVDYEEYEDKRRQFEEESEYTEMGRDHLTGY